MRYAAALRGGEVSTDSAYVDAFPAPAWRRRVPPAFIPSLIYEHRKHPWVTILGENVEHSCTRRAPRPILDPSAVKA